MGQTVQANRSGGTYPVQDLRGQAQGEVFVRHGGKGDAQTTGAGTTGTGQNGGHQAEGQQGRDIFQAGSEVQQALEPLRRLHD